MALTYRSEDVVWDEVLEATEEVLTLVQSNQIELVSL